MPYLPGGEMIRKDMVHWGLFRSSPRQPCQYWARQNIGDGFGRRRLANLRVLNLNERPKYWPGHQNLATIQTAANTSGQRQRQKICRAATGCIPNRPLIPRTDHRGGTPVGAAGLDTGVNRQFITDSM